MELATTLGKVVGGESDHSYYYLGLPYAKAGRFEYATLVNSYGKSFNATKFGPACTQKRVYFEHLEVPERAFYHKEFREGIKFKYSEDCLNLNIYTPKGKQKGGYPVIVFIHGGGFDSGANSESPFDGDAFAEKGVITVFIQYRVGVFGYFTHDEIQKKYGHDGNFGLDDQVKALHWVHAHISEFGGNANNVTLMGQSAGAMSIQYLLYSEKAKGLFQKAIMMSGAGRWPKPGAPKEARLNHGYWLEVMKECGCPDFDSFKNADPKTIFEALEKVKARRKDNMQSTMPVYDHYYLAKPYAKLFYETPKIPMIVGFTNNDMFTVLLAYQTMHYAKLHNAYCYYFDVDAPGDANKAFHSADLRYAFGTLDRSWRPYGEEDKAISEQMMTYFANFAKIGNPNSEGLPFWKKKAGMCLAFSKKGTKMKRPEKFTLLCNTFLGDPK